MRINLERLFVTYPIAKKLKELKFYDGVMAYFKEDKRKPGEFGLWPSMDPEFHVKYQYGQQNKLMPETLTSAPTHQQVVDWLRKKHNIVIEVSLYYKEDKNSWTYDIMEYGTYKTYLGGISKYRLSKDYYIALNKAIKYAIKLIEKENGK